MLVPSPIFNKGLSGLKAGTGRFSGEYQMNGPEND